MMGMGNNKKGPSGCVIGLIVCIAAPIFIYGIVLLYYAINTASNNIDKALEKKDFEKAERIVSKMADSAESREITWEEYKDAYYRVLNAEVDYLCKDGSNMSVDRLVSLFQNKKMGGYPYVGISVDKTVRESNDRYNKSISRHHLVLDRIITRAITEKNRYLATSIINCYRPLIVSRVIKTHIFSEDEIEYSYSYEQQEQARERVETAIKKGEL